MTEIKKKRVPITLEKTNKKNIAVLSKEAIENKYYLFEVRFSDNTEWRYSVCGFTAFSGEFGR